MIEYRVMDKKDYKESLWSGGRTIELYIYPENSDFADRDFDYRISSATVENEESDFSKFEGYRRFITPIEGKMKLEHENYHRVLLDKYKIDTFHGDWQTKSIGKCRDFNLIMKKDINSSMEIINKDIESKAKKIFIVSFEEDLDIILKSKDGKEEIKLLEENLLEIDNKEEKDFEIRFGDKVNNVILISLDK